MKDRFKEPINRRTFFKFFGTGTTIAATSSLIGCSQKNPNDNIEEPPIDQMTYRTNPKTNERVSILGFGMMRLPIQGNGSARETKEPIDQEATNRLVSYAIKHGVNYFDTAPVYCNGQSEHATGIALHKYPRDSYYVATKLSNFAPETQSREASIAMFNNSLKELQVDYIDYYLLHAIGMNGMDAYNERYIDNGMLDWLVEQRKIGKIRNLGFSYHGDIEVFDHLLSLHDKYKWDFVQIELNYLDWSHASEINDRNTNASYLYEELTKRNIPAIIMEPLLGGRLSNLPNKLITKLKQRDPEKSIASWAFRYAATPPNVLTVLSGMTYMEHLKDNLLSYCPLKPLSTNEQKFLEDIATEYVNYDMIPCNNCKYCMPCPYGIDIPSIFVHYNKCLTENNVPQDSQDPDYVKQRRAFLIGYDRSVPRLRQANHCIGCGVCISHCPQDIMIPAEMRRIDQYVEQLKQETL